MAKSKKGGSSNHTLKQGSSRAAAANDSSRKIQSSKSVGETLRSGVAVGNSEKGKDKGPLR